MTNIFTRILGDPNERVVRKLRARVERINALEDEMRALSDRQMQAETKKFQAELESGKQLDDILERAFAVVREAGHRVIKQRHFDVQLLGGIVLHQGGIAEMRTGEGKTLVATLPLYLNALEGEGAHLVTVNDYLARIGAGWMGQIYHFLGLSTAVIMHDSSFVYDPDYTDDTHADERLRHLRPVTRKEAYAADITYGTNNEFGFDYLRDNMVQHVDQMVQRSLHYAIVDEVDSILIDEARTPLIISQPHAKPTDRYYQFAKIAASLKRDEDYTVDEKQKAVSITEGGITRIEKALGVDNVYEAGRIEDVHHIEAALKAEAVFQKDRDYVVSADGEIIIVDEFTGRMLPGRRYSEGLHQAIEAKEGVEIQQESQTLATVSFQNLFRLYKKLSGMTGTAVTEAEEFGKIYKLDVTTIPTHQPMIREDMPDKIYKTEKAKFEAVAQDVAERHAKGQPVLLGTVSIEKNEHLSAQLTKAGVPHRVLNAKNNEAEAEIIAAAGQKGAVTLATNIAGRGTDIVLDDEVAELGGLHVIGTERHESRRIDNQLRGRAGRQGDPGSSQFYVSLEDDLMRIFGSERIGTMMDALGLPDDTPIENRMVSRSLESAQKKVEGHNFDIRKNLVEYDDVMNQHREIMYARRRAILKKDSLKDDMLPIFEAEFRALIAGATDEQTGILDLEKLAAAVRDVIPLEKGWETSQKTRDHDVIIKQFMDIVEETYRQRYLEFGDEGVMVIERMVSLNTIDSAWLEHLEAMEHLRGGIGLRGYAQRDPLVEYKQESFRMFGELQRRVDSEIAHTFFKVRVELAAKPEEQAIETEITKAVKQAVDIAASSQSDAKVSRDRALRESARSGREKGVIRRTTTKPSSKKKHKKKKRR
ncbi:preprotein translocase subunit SecA [bacterium]|nr:preprotein translocase subunit SecA [bacterium]